MATIVSLNWASAQGARAIDLRSGLRHFSAGADLDAMLEDVGDGDTLDWGFAETLREFAEHPAPIIASVHGACVGGGFELALACDLVIASATAKIGSVEVTVGLHPDRSGGEIRIPGRPWHFAGIAAAQEAQMPARQGEHNNQVLAELGYSQGEIATLVESGALIEPGRGAVSAEPLEVSAPNAELDHSV